MKTHKPDMAKVERALSNIDVILRQTEEEGRLSSQLRQDQTYDASRSLLATFKDHQKQLRKACAALDAARICRLTNGMIAIVAALFAPPIALAVTVSLSLISTEFVCPKMAKPK